MRVQRYEDAATFLSRAQDVLRAEPVTTTVIGTVAARAAAHPSPVASGTPQWWATVEDGPHVVGLAMRAAPWSPFPLHVGPMPEPAAAALADALLAEQPTVTEVNGAREAALAIAARLASASASSIETAMHLRLHELADLEVPADPPGRWRLATVADGDVVLDWYERFHAEADEQAGRPPDPNPPHFAPGELEARIDDGLMSLWVLDDLPVHLTAWNSPAHGVVRVGPVFTPREHRGRGYAAAAVARVSAAALEAGHRAVLLTDQANPTSKALYERLGYRPVTDMVNLRIVAN